MANSSPCCRMRCHHCAGPLSKELETSEWTVAPLVRDSFSMIGSAVGGTTSVFYGFNQVMPIVQRWIKGPMWLHFLIGDLTTGKMIDTVRLDGGLYLFKDGLTSIRLSQSTVLNSICNIRWRGWTLLGSVGYDVGRLSPAYCSSQAPPVIVFSSACAGLTGGAIPALAQLSSSAYHAAVSSSSNVPSHEDKMHKSRTSTL